MADQPRAEQVRPDYNGASGRPYPTFGVHWFTYAVFVTVVP